MRRQVRFLIRNATFTLINTAIIGNVTTPVEVNA
jgi:hypothetical protein